MWTSPPRIPQPPWEFSFPSQQGKDGSQLYLLLPFSWNKHFLLDLISVWLLPSSHVIWTFHEWNTEMMSGASKQNHSWAASGWSFIVHYLCRKNFTKLSAFPWEWSEKASRISEETTLCHLWLYKDSKLGPHLTPSSSLANNSLISGRKPCFLRPPFILEQEAMNFLK